MHLPSRLIVASGQVERFLHGSSHPRWRKTCMAFMLLLMAFAVVRMLPLEGPDIVMRIHASQSGVAQWFLDSGHGYTEQESVKATLKRGNNLVRFSLPPGQYRRLRFDPLKSDDPVTIRSASIRPRARVISGNFGLDDFSGAVAIAKLTRTDAGLRIVPTRGTHDPQLAVKLVDPLVVEGPPRNLAEDVMAASMMAALAWLLLNALFTRMSLALVVRLGLAGALVMIVAMNVVSLSGGSLHPDERLHVACFEFFLHHFWPPAADSPGIVPSLQSSVWGVSYLNNYDVVYFIAGHVMAPFAGILDSPKAMARVFQNLLWLGLLGFSLRKKAWALALAAVLISPQVWYIFSYFNGDALPFFLCSVAVMLVCDRNGGLARYLRQGGWPTMGAVGFSLCLGLTLVSKTNYAPVVMGLFLWLAVRYMGARWLELFATVLMAGFAIAGVSLGKWAGLALAGHAETMFLLAGLSGLVASGCLLWRYARDRDRSMRPVLHRGLVLLGLVLMFAAPRVINDLYINGGAAAKAATVNAMKEKYARSDFKPSVIEAGKGYPGLHPSREGVSLGELLTGYRHWLTSSAKSAFGTYGYMDVWAPRWLYRLSWLSVFVWVVASIAALLRRRKMDGAKQVFVVIGTSALVFISSLFFSWLYDFQSQGRYLLPIVPMLALMFNAAMPLLPPRLVKVLLVIALALSAWSFVGVGIPELAARAA